MKYRLKTAYPGGPKVGTISETKKYVYQGTVIDVTEYPELWEQIEVTQDKPAHKTMYHASLHDINYDGSYHGLLRIEDNAYFQVGTMTERGPIKTIFKSSAATISGIVAVLESGEVSDLHHKIGNEFYLNPRKYILTTYDGVDIYKGSFTWVISANSNVPSISTFPDITPKDMIHFSTKEAALQYGMDNVKNLSINDIRAATVSGEIKNKDFEAKLREFSYKQQKC